jgi:hypothetical protein
VRSERRRLREDRQRRFESNALMFRSRVQFIMKCAMCGREHNSNGIETFARSTTANHWQYLESQAQPLSA